MNESTTYNTTTYSISMEQQSKINKINHNPPYSKEGRTVVERRSRRTESRFSAQFDRKIPWFLEEETSGDGVEEEPEGRCREIVRHSPHLATANGGIKRTGESFSSSNATPFIVTTYRPSLSQLGAAYPVLIVSTLAVLVRACVRVQPAAHAQASHFWTRSPPRHHTNFYHALLQHPLVSLLINLLIGKRS